MKARAYLVLALAMLGCVRNYEVPSRDWGIVRSGEPAHVRTYGGDAFALDSFAFTVNALVVTRGRRVAPVEAPLTQPFEIPLDSVAVVRVRRSSPRAAAGIALGVAAIATAAVLIQASGEDPVRPEPVPRPAGGSCPYIYSFDGSSYVFDSETYAGAIARGLERTDVDNLEHLRPAGGVYRLALANEMDETQYTDEIALLVADHPSGTRVFPDASGAARVVGRGTEPLRVVEFGGRDSLLAPAGWEVEFARPEGVERAVVIVTGRNTPLPSFAAAHMLSLMGPSVYGWYAAMNDDSAARNEMVEWLTYETSLRVLTRKHDSWSSVGTLPSVGPAIDKTQVISVDLSEHVGDTVRVRLEATPLVWQLETVELAPDLGAATLRPAELLRARAEDGSDVSALLSAADGLYHVALNGSRVELEYRVPADAGAERTALARTTGHYYITVDDSDGSRAFTALRIMNDQEFARQYFLSVWDEAVAAGDSGPSR